MKRRHESPASELWSLKRCNCKTTLTNSKTSCLVLDRISGLKEELLGKILSLLPTKEAVCTSAFSRRWRSVYGWVTNLEFNDFPISGRFQCQELISRYITHVDTVLRVCHVTDMTRFSLKVGEYSYDYFDLEPAHVNRWISFPLSRTVREIDLCVHVKRPGKLPPQLFSLDKVQVLKIDSNLEVETSGPFALLSLKLLHLKTLYIPDSDLLAALLLGCPSLLELQVENCNSGNSPVLKISHPFLERLSLDMPSIKIYKTPMCSHCSVFDEEEEEYKRTDVVLDTPNLQYLKYADNMALRYSAGNLNALVEADIHIVSRLDYEETYYQSMLSLLSLLAKIHSLTLCDSSLPDCEAFQLKEKLVLLDLKDLNFCVDDFSGCFLLFDLLHCSPHLERLTLPQGGGNKFELSTLG